MLMRIPPVGARTYLTNGWLSGSHTFHERCSCLGAAPAGPVERAGWRVRGTAGEAREARFNWCSLWQHRHGRDWRDPQCPHASTDAPDACCATDAHRVLIRSITGSLMNTEMRVIQS